MLTPANEKAITGCLLGMAVGDALGLPCENMSPRRQLRLCPSLEGYHFLFRRGMTSDDTEHQCMVGQALLASGGESEAFRRSLAWRLRWWLLGLPAGIGRATLRSLVKLWFGGREGVWSAGNGPAMRAPLLGVCIGHDPERMRALVRASTRLTHTDPKAEHGALAIALAAYRSSRLDSPPDPERYLHDLHPMVGKEGAELMELLEQAKSSAGRGETTSRFAEGMGWKRGVSGYILHTVPAVLQTWFRYPDDLTAALTEMIRAGGDSDTTAAILGAILGARVGREGIPERWLDHLWEWPRSVRWMEKLGHRLATAKGENGRAVSLFVPGLVLRNLLFLFLVLLHALRRCFPPY